MKRFLTTLEASVFLRLKQNTLEGWRCRKKGPKYIRLGRRIVYDIADLEAFANECTVETDGSARPEENV